MIAKRLQYGPRFQKIFGVLGVYSFTKYLFDAKHKNHKDTQIGFHDWRNVEGPATGFDRIARLLARKGRSLADELKSFTGEGVPELPQREVDHYLKSKGVLPSTESPSPAWLFLANFDRFLSGVEELAAKRKALGKSRWSGELVEPLSICPLGGSNLSDDERATIARTALSKLSAGAKALAIWHVGKPVELDGKKVTRDDLHLLIWNLVDVPFGKPQCRTTILRKRRKTTDYLEVLRDYCERTVTTINRERQTLNIEPMPSLKKRREVLRKKLNRREIAEELAACLDALDEQFDPAAASIAVLSKSAAEFGWKVEELQTRDGRTQVAVTAPDKTKARTFEANRLYRAIAKHLSSLRAIKPDRDQDGDRSPIL